MMEPYSQQDLEHAAEFREWVHQEALERVRAVHPEIDRVVDRYPVTAYFDKVWDYPGAWYTMIAVPPEVGSRKKLVEIIVRDTLKDYEDRAARNDFRISNLPKK